MHTLTAPLVSSALLRVDLDTITAEQVLRVLSRLSDQPQLLVDCGSLQCLRTMGVSYVVSELLVLRRSGVPVWLRAVDPVLRRCLHLLQLERLFPVVE